MTASGGGAERLLLRDPVKRALEPGRERRRRGPAKVSLGQPAIERENLFADRARNMLDRQALVGERDGSASDVVTGDALLARDVHRPVEVFAMHKAGDGVEQIIDVDQRADLLAIAPHLDLPA